jgi:ketosteroid isomerase-like protein
VPSNTDLVRAAFKAVDENDIEALLPMLSEEIEFHSLTGMVAGRGPYLGHDGMREWDHDRNTTWHLEAETTSFEEKGDLVLVGAHIRTTGGVSGVRFDTPTSWVVRVGEDGKIRSIEGFTDHDAARRIFEDGAAT